MQVPIISYLRKAKIKREFLRTNPDVSEVFWTKRSSPSSRSASPEPLSPAEIEQWNKSGFMILRGFFPQSRLDDYTDHIDRLWQERKHPGNPLVIFTARGKLYFRDALDGDRLQTYRLVDHYMTDAATRDFSMDRGLVEILRQLMGHAPVVCNTILFERGSEQDMHSDMFFMPPATENQMLATWIAIDDVDENNGPVIYVPGSHKIAPHRFANGTVKPPNVEELSDAVAGIEKRMSDLGLRKQRFTARRGDVLIWHSQLVHGGDAIKDRSAKRTSIVTHYFSTCDVPRDNWLCAERKDGSLMMIKEHLPVAENESVRPAEPH